MICSRCGREQPALASPCPDCGLLDSESPIPALLLGSGQTPSRGGDSESSKRPKSPQPYFCKDCGRRFYNIGWHCEACGSSNYEPVSSGLEPQADCIAVPSRLAQPSSPVQIAFMRAHRAWAKRFQPWLLKEWLA
jgi:predicted amidophosphoribosyltransferase